MATIIADAPHRPLGEVSETSAASLHAFLVAQGCFSIRHSGRTLGDHLVNTYALVKTLGGRESTALAGGLHSIYGTNAFDKTTMDYSMRASLAAQFGARAEYLAYLFSRINRPRDIETGKAFDRRTKTQIELSGDDLHDLRLIEAANLHEQGYDLSKYHSIAAVAPSFRPAPEADQEEPTAARS